MNNDLVKIEHKIKLSRKHLENQVELANRISKESLKFISLKLKSAWGDSLEDFVAFILEFYESKLFYKEV